jgi:hypothetical protein
MHIMHRTSLLFAPLLAAALAAAPAYAAAQHDVPWYLANRGALQAELTACAANPGDLAATPDCVNAGAAQQQIAIAGL